MPRAEQMFPAVGKLEKAIFELMPPEEQTKVRRRKARALAHSFGVRMKE